MPDFVQRLDVVHEVHFAQPAFALLREMPTVLRTFYETLTTRFAVSTEHMSTASTNTLSEFSVRIGLFNNVAAIEVRAERMTIRLPNINNPESIAIAKDTITLAQEALFKSLPDVSISRSSFVGHSWIVLEGAAEALEAFFKRNATPSEPISASHWGASTLRNSLRMVARNEDEEWGVTVFGEPALLPGTHLFLSTEFTFNRRMPINDQLIFIESKFRQIATTLGLNLPAEVSSNG